MSLNLNQYKKQTHYNIENYYIPKRMNHPKSVLTNVVINYSTK